MPAKMMPGKTEARSNLMNWRMRISILLIAISTLFTLWCLYVTTAISMTAFFSLGVPLYGLGVLLFLWEIVLDLKEHRVL